MERELVSPNDAERSDLMRDSELAREAAVREAVAREPYMKLKERLATEAEAQEGDEERVRVARQHLERVNRALSERHDRVGNEAANEFLANRRLAQRPLAKVMDQLEELGSKSAGLVQLRPIEGNSAATLEMVRAFKERLGCEDTPFRQDKHAYIGGESFFDFEERKGSIRELNYRVGDQDGSHMMLTERWSGSTGELLDVVVTKSKKEPLRKNIFGRKVLTRETRRMLYDQSRENVYGVSLSGLLAQEEGQWRKEALHPRTHREVTKDFQANLRAAGVPEEAAAQYSPRHETEADYRRADYEEKRRKKEQGEEDWQLLREDFGDIAKDMAGLMRYWWRSGVKGDKEPPHDHGLARQEARKAAQQTRERVEISEEDRLLQEALEDTRASLEQRVTMFERQKHGVLAVRPTTSEGPTKPQSAEDLAPVEELYKRVGREPAPLSAHKYVSGHGELMTELVYAVKGRDEGHRDGERARSIVLERWSDKSGDLVEALVVKNGQPLQEAAHHRQIMSLGSREVVNQLGYRVEWDDLHQLGDGAGNPQEAFLSHMEHLGVPREVARLYPLGLPPEFSWWRWIRHATRGMGYVRYGVSERDYFPR